jgi:AcrR family transcriptional regulator
MNQVAEAADVSPSTLFRYFPTKESLVLWDEFDLPILQALVDQPARTGPVPALRAALRKVLSELTEDQRHEMAERLTLILDLPPVRTALLDQASGPMQQLAAVLAQRAGRPFDDLAARTVVGAMVGVALAALFSATNQPEVDLIDRIDEALGRLEAGLPL